MSEAPRGLSRRAFIRRCSAAALAIPLSFALADAAVAEPPSLPGVEVRPRSAWAQGLPTPGPLEQEQPTDVRFLIVHHSASPNGYAPGEVPAVLRGFHAFHTGPDKGWSDVAYNFFIDRYGAVWEGRAGSIAGPIKPDATGGSQGFSQICCFIGDHTVEPPTLEARQAMTLLLAGLADRYVLDPLATTTFISRGSNRWPAGTSVNTRTIAGHRDMSMTTCPGDAAYPLVRDDFPGDVAAILATRSAQSASSPPEPTAGPPVPPTADGAPPSTPSSTSESLTAGGGTPGEGEGVQPIAVALVAAGVVAAGTTLGLVQHVRHRQASVKKVEGTVSGTRPTPGSDDAGNGPGGP
ncbi:MULTISPECIES: N-acetylmuramoyl-L-alanine amidase [unclassified Modestobacter]|uniref:N-acetylmuramoyl-L-alanine amidase n=1 Tax=unclassified Modestobacter TaxID=2643866 RepID=UPI0022AAC8DB|nr:MULTISPECIES: N-acetylmuramoyl-L-alanine amidase [unclassified Modestobacter]MCZ2826075.1 N-acetylmuramoyl-L-alanine amidase [Modestobacter sp. VKM Ac-2981]MCZ2852860.1 N-acetylmuramoyl-L-alanine amidase [Modestobacter sp. VKM Ac-2982]